MPLNNIERLSIAVITSLLLLVTTAQTIETSHDNRHTGHNLDKIRAKQFYGQARKSNIQNSTETRHCDNDKCDSLVSKCILTQRCMCDFRNDPRCAKDCIDCLEEKFGKCCACVGLCPVPDNDNHASHVGETNASDEDYFVVLTETDDILGRWSVDTTATSGVFVNHPELGRIEVAYRRAWPDESGVNSTKHMKAIISHDTHLKKLPCIAAFINSHLSMAKCKQYCVAMGASHFRWFHDGCCECVGKYCLNYGVDEPRCLIDID